MYNIKVGSAIESFLSNKKVTDLSEDGTEQEVCDMNTGVCHTILSKDGLVERINKKYLTDDGRQLLSD